MSEIFIAGDPRWLSGGAVRAEDINYSRRPPRLLEGEDTVTTEKLVNDGYSAVAVALRDYDQSVHRGRSGYHSRPMMNIFLDSENPTVGVELETEEKLDISIDDMLTALSSNWFHFESDSSLATGGHQGYELITEPLPPFRYRDIRLWTGLQNLLTPWVESYKHSCTGLHVHVGLEQFEDRDDLGFQSRIDRRWAGKYLSAAVYYALTDRTLSDTVFLRKNGHYCSDGSNGLFAAISSAADAGGLTGRAFTDMVLSTVLVQFVQTWLGGAQCLREYAMSSSLNAFDYKFVSSPMTGFDGHGSEVNCHNAMTIEFRRGKGTLNAISIHRMVEFATHVVKYAGHILDNPDQKVSKKAFSEYIIENTNSAALKLAAEKGI